MITLQAHSNLLIARLQRSDLFAAGLPALWPAESLLREAEQWLRDVESSLPSLPDADLIPLLSNYDLLHRLTRRRPGTPLLRLACQRVLDAWADTDPTRLPSYVYDAARLLSSLSPQEVPPSAKKFSILNPQSSIPPSGNQFSIPLRPSPQSGDKFSILNFKFSIPPRGNQSSIPPRGNQFSILNSKFSIPLSDYPEQISLLRISAERGVISPDEAVTLLSPIYDSIPFAPAAVLHSLLLFTVRCRHLLQPHLDPEAAIRRINKALSIAPDNHPLDRQARLQHLANDTAFRQAQAQSTPVPHA